MLPFRVSWLALTRSPTSSPTSHAEIGKISKRLGWELETSGHSERQQQMSSITEETACTHFVESPAPDSEATLVEDTMISTCAVWNTDLCVCTAALHQTPYRAFAGIVQVSPTSPLHHRVDGLTIVNSSVTLNLRQPPYSRCDCADVLLPFRTTSTPVAANGALVRARRLLSYSIMLLEVYANPMCMIRSQSWG